jgi:hypothetical protein
MAVELDTRVWRLLDSLGYEVDLMGDTTAPWMLCKTPPEYGNRRVDIILGTMGGVSCLDLRLWSKDRYRRWIVSAPYTYHIGWIVRFIQAAVSGVWPMRRGLTLIDYEDW